MCSVASMWMRWLLVRQHKATHDDSEIANEAPRGGRAESLTLLLSLSVCTPLSPCVPPRLGAPWVVTKDLITTLNLHIVASGSTTKMDQDVEAAVSASHKHPHAAMGDAYAIPKSMGIYKEIDSTSSLTTEDVVTRLIKNRQEYEQRNAKRAPKEEKYNAQKTFIAEI